MRIEKLLRKLRSDKFLSQITEAANILADEETDKARYSLLSELCEVTGTLAVLEKFENQGTQIEISEEEIAKYEEDCSHEDFLEELEFVLNKYGVDADLNTPDYVLADKVDKFLYDGNN